MGTSKNKVRLSPRLRQGVGRSYSKNNLFKYSGFVFLVLSIGLGIWTITVIAKHSGSSVAETAANPQILGASDNPEAEPFIKYTVVKGDTIFNIAQKYKVDWTTLATINNINSPFTLKIGQEVKIPSPK